MLWERGHIDNTDGLAYQKYNTNGTRDEFGITKPETSLKQLMSRCLDFEEEESMLQSMVRKMGYEVDRTPKCHAEMAGDGIEYIWALIKNHFRRILLHKKRGKENFMKCVRECLSKELITTTAVRLMARRARRYTKGYHVLHQMKSGKIVGALSEELKNAKGFDIITTKIEYIVGEFKSHRAASDFDHGFCRTIFKESLKRQQNS